MKKRRDCRQLRHWREENHQATASKLFQTLREVSGYAVCGCPLMLAGRCRGNPEPLRNLGIANRCQSIGNKRAGLRTLRGDQRFRKHFWLEPYCRKWLETSTSHGFGVSCHRKQDVDSDWLGWINVFHLCPSNIGLQNAR